MMHSLLTFRASIAGDRWSVSRLATGLALLLGAVGREEAMALPGGERLVRWLRLK